MKSMKRFHLQRIQSVSQTPASTTGKAAFTLVELLVVIAIIGVLVGLLLPAVQQAREAVRRNSCQNNVKQLALAVLNYHDARSQFPPGNIGFVDWQCGGVSGTGPAIGFLVQVLPFIEEQSRFDQFRLSEPVTSTTNRAATGALPPNSYRCPSYDGPMAGDMDYGCSSGIAGGRGATCYAGVQCSSAAGDAGASPGSAQAGVFYLEATGEAGASASYAKRRARVTQIKDVLDGTSNTLLCGEIRPDAMRVLFPDKPFDPLSWGGLYCAWSLGFARRAATIRYNQYGPNQFWTSSASDDWRMQMYIPFASKHPGGVVMAKADGSGTFVTDTVDITIWRDAANIAGGETRKLP